MEMPDEVLCEKCGGSAAVITQDIDQSALKGDMPAADRRWQDGFFFTIECPHCGTRMQSLAPPP